MSSPSERRTTKDHLPRLRLRSILILIGCFAFVCYIGVFFERITRSSRLIKAAYRGDVSSVQDLLALGADVHARDGWNSTALMYAAGNGHLDIIQLLLKHGVPIDERSRMHRTPLMWAAQSGNMVVVKLLIEQGADPSLTDDEGKIATDLADKNGHSRVASYLNSVSPK